MKGIDVIKQYINLQEIRDNKQLRELFKSQSINGDLDIDPAKIPWCAAIVNACERKAGNKGTGKLNARSFLKYGEPVDLKDAQEGDIVIFSRGSNGWSGHVTYLYKNEDYDNMILCLGGNQSDSVCYANYTIDRLLGIRRIK